MMRVWLFIMMALWSKFMMAQVNLVPNYSFEVFDTCPYNVEQLEFVPPWFQPNAPNLNSSGSTDYYNACSMPWLMGVPENTLGYQYAHTGAAYAGFGLFSIETDNSNREYLEVKLDSGMNAQSKYCVSFYVSLPGEKGGFCSATSAVGVYLSNDTCQYYSPSNFDTLTVRPQLINPATNVVADTSNWWLMKWTYTPQGGERFITIGNFWGAYFNAPRSYTICSLGDGAYFYIDDVSVVRLPFIQAGNDTTIVLGDSIPLNGSISETWPGMQFEWQPHTGLSNPYALTTVAAPSTTTTYTLTVNCPACEVPCLDEVTDSIRLAVNKPQTLSLNIPTLVKSGELFSINDLPENSRLRIFDARGRIVYDISDYRNNLDFSRFDAGVYTYELFISNEERYSGKVVFVK